MFFNLRTQRARLILVLSVVIFLTSFFLYTYKLSSSFTYHTDIARDADEMTQLAQGDFTLIGPRLNLGGFHAGPYYYYLFAPILLLSSFDFDFVLIFNALLFSLALIYLFKKVSEKYSLIWALFSSAVFMILPLYHLVSRNPGNAYTYMPLLLIFLTHVYFNNVYKKVEFLTLGLLAGIITNFHPLNILVFMPIFLYLFFSAKKKADTLFLLLGVIITYLPLLIFELTHNFVIIKKMAYSFSIGELPLSPKGENVSTSSLLDNYLNSQRVVREFILFSPFVYLILFALSLVKFLKIKSSDKLLFFTFGSLVSFILYAVAFRGDIGPHYVFPFAFFMFFSLWLLLLSNNIRFFALIIILVEIMVFNTSLYETSGRPKEKFEEAVDFTLQEKLVTKDDSFNIIQSVEKVPAGHEYRFFYRARGYKPKSINAYDSSNILLVFDDRDDYRIEDLRNWETSQFGQEYLNNYEKYSTGKVKIYKFSKI